jgi:hypothetical protein
MSFIFNLTVCFINIHTNLFMVAVSKIQVTQI